MGMLDSISTVLLHHSIAFFQLAFLLIVETVKLCSHCFLLRSFLVYIEPYLLKVNFSIIRCTKLLVSASALVISSSHELFSSTLRLSSKLGLLTFVNGFDSKHESSTYTFLGQDLTNLMKSYQPSPCLGEYVLFSFHDVFLEAISRMCFVSPHLPL